MQRGAHGSEQFREYEEKERQQEARIAACKAECQKNSNDLQLLQGQVQQLREELQSHEAERI